MSRVQKVSCELADDRECVYARGSSEWTMGRDSR